MHRRRSHNEAHDGPHDHAAPQVMEHPLVPAGDPVLVTTQNELDRLVQRLRAAERFAYDTEFIGEETYHPRLCLVQVAAADEGIALIDPLSRLDLRGFWELIANASVEKVVHAGVQDLEPVVRHVGAPPRHVFDTQLAAAFAGLGYPMSLDRLVTALAGVDPGRGAKFSQWDHRPLTPVQLRYAANDVRYLLLLRQLIGEKLAAMGNATWAAARCQELSDLSLYQFDARSQKVRVRGIEWLTPRQRAVLRALLAWREEAAMAQDLPPRSLVRDDLLVVLAREPVEKAADLSRVRGLPRPVRQSEGEAIVAATRRGMTSALDPTDLEPTQGRRAKDRATDEAWKAVQQWCVARGVDPTVVTSKREFLAFVGAAIAGGPVGEHRLGNGWRRQWLGPALDEAVASVRGEAASQA